MSKDDKIQELIAETLSRNLRYAAQHISEHWTYADKNNNYVACANALAWSARRRTDPYFYPNEEFKDENAIVAKIYKRAAQIFRG